MEIFNYSLPSVYSYTYVIENIIFCAMQLSVSDNIIKFVGCLL